MCDTNPTRTAQSLQPMQSALTDAVALAVSDKTITAASVYFRELQGGQQVNVNPNESFFPSSLRKVPLLITVLKSVEVAPNILEKLKIRIAGQDQNGGQEIQPKDPARIGSTYTVEDLLGRMISFSDNNAAQALSSLVGMNTLKQVFQALGVPFVTADDTVKNVADIDRITAYQYSFFFRILFNATYLNPEYSEMALTLLSKAEYKQGIVAGVPSELIVAHKFGLLTLKDSEGNIAGRQLHDCGIVYYPNKPYILCVMTKSTANLERIEEFIKNISNVVYTQVASDANKK